MSLTSLLTPKRTPTVVAAEPTSNSPGTWRHPRYEEIVRRRDQTHFSERNMRQIIFNVLVIVGLCAVDYLLGRHLKTSRGQFKTIRWCLRSLNAIPAWNIAVAAAPLTRARDNMSDIPLTSGQRQLLGLPESPAPVAPGTVYTTPPKYARTPSWSASSGNRSMSAESPFSNSWATPLSDDASFRGSGRGQMPVVQSNSPLFQKTMRSAAARRSSINSAARPSTPTLGASTATSLLGASTGSAFGGTDSPTPSPKKISLSVSNKWAYDRKLRP